MPHEDELARAREALAAGRTVVVTGPWSTGRTRLARLLGSEGVPVVDDAHLLGEADAVRLAAELDRPHVLTVPDGRRLAPALRRAAADAVVVELRAWDAGEVESWRPEADGDELQRWTGGLPALLVATVEDGGPGEVGPAVRARVAGLVEELDAEEREVLTTLMAAGPVPASIADLALPAAAVDALLLRGVVAERTEGDVPDLVAVAEVLWRAPTAWLSARRVREARRDLAARTGADGLARLSLHQRLRVARWAADAGGDLPLVRQGVRPAMLLGRPELAVELGRQVLAREPGDAATRDLVTIAFEALGDHARATATSAPDPTAPLGATALARHATNVYLATLDPGSAQQVAPAAPGPADENGEAAALLGWMQLLMGDVDDACATSSPVLGDPGSSVQARVWAGLDFAVGDVVRGGGAECLALLDLSRRIAVAQPAGLTPYSEFQVATSRCVALVRLGRGDEALPEAETGLAGATDPQLQAAWHGVAGLAARETGRFERGAEHFAAIGEILLGDPFGLGTWAASESAVCAAMAGLPAPWAPDEETPIGLTEALLARNTAWTLAVSDPAAAAELALSSAATARQRGQVTHEVLALVDAARFGRAADAVVALGAVERVDNPLVRAGATVVSALLRGRPAELGDAARACGRVGWHVVGEELLVVARARLVAAGRPALAARLELAQQGQRWPTPLLAAERAPAYLTPREVEVGRLAVEGVASAAIAVRLSVSQRTVDNLLGRVYAKCGVSGRRVLAEAVPRLRATAAR